MNKVEILQEYRRTLSIEKVTGSLLKDEIKKGYQMTKEDARKVVEAVVLDGQRRKN